MTPLLAQLAAEQAGGGTAEFVVFVVVGAISLGSAISMVMMRNATHAALMLVVNFFTIAVFYAVLEAQFLAVTQIIVYAGAIMVLFLFVIMLLGLGREETPTRTLRGQRAAAVVLALVLFVGIAASAAAPFMGEASVCDGQAAGEGIVCRGLAEVNAGGNVQALGQRLFTDYVWPFEVTSVLLVIAAVGAIVVGRKTDDPRELVDRVASDDARAAQQSGEAYGPDRDPDRAADIAREEASG
jgi:NADH-quinone oxidoreductase subunit J